MSDSVSWGPTPSASFLYVLWICLFVSISYYCVCLSQRESDWKMFLSEAQRRLNCVVGHRGQDNIITLLIILEKWPSSCVCLNTQGNKKKQWRTQWPSKGDIHLIHSVLKEHRNNFLKGGVVSCSIDLCLSKSAGQRVDIYILTSLTQ